MLRFLLVLLLFFSVSTANAQVCKKVEGKLFDQQTEREVDEVKLVIQNS